MVLRSAAELTAAVRANPYLGRDPTTDALHLVFLADQPTAAAVASLNPARSPPDEYTVIGRDIYLRCPAGVGPEQADQRLLRSTAGDGEHGPQLAHRHHAPRDGQRLIGITGPW